MTQQIASRTAEFMALFRALESTRRPAARRLFTDPFARDLLRPVLRAVVDLSRVPIAGAMVARLIDRRWPGARSSGVARTRLIDDAIEKALRDGVGQVVILGAGFDCRAYRVRGIQRARVFEVDRGATLAAKRLRLTQILGVLPAHVIFVEVDFNRQALDQQMEASGFDPSARSFFIWEGVTNYLTAAAVDSTLRYIGTNAVPGNRLIFTYVHRGVIDGSVPFEGTRNLAATLGRAGEPWTFGIDPAEAPTYLADYGFELIEDLGATEYRARYMGPSGRCMKGYEFYRTALAEVRGAARSTASSAQAKAGSPH